MDLKRKDNLSDLVEQLPRIQTQTSVETQRVVNSEGEIVTLGKENSPRQIQPIKGNSLELYITRFKQGFDEILDEIRSRYKR